MCYRYYFVLLFCVFFFKQKTAYEMRISDWSSDVCSSDLRRFRVRRSRPVLWLRPGPVRAECVLLEGWPRPVRSARASPNRVRAISSWHPEKGKTEMDGGASGDAWVTRRREGNRCAR